MPRDDGTARHPQLDNAYGHEDAKASIEFIKEQRQIISDASLKIAGEMKSIEKRGGNRQGIQFALRMMGQDINKTRKELEAMDQVRAWFLEPLLKDAEKGEGGE